MKIGIMHPPSDGTGIDNVVVGCLKELGQIDHRNEYFDLTTKHPKLNLPTIPSSLACYEGVSGGAIDYTCYRENISLIHSYFNPFDNLHNNCKKVLTIHDLICLRHPEWCLEGLYHWFDSSVRASAMMADAIVADSIATKMDVIELFQIPEEKIHVIYPAVNHELLGFDTDSTTCDVDVIRRLGLDTSRYILSVCTLEPRKNLRGLIRGFAQYKTDSKDQETKLVLTGRLGWDHDFMEFLDGLGTIKEDIILTGFVSSEELHALYQEAMAVAYMSFYEGFGLPILEGMEAGKAVICSDTTSMPEVGGDSVCYANPYDVESIADAIRRVTTDDAYRNHLEQKAISRAAEFSYEKTARQLLDLYESLVD